MAYKPDSPQQLLKTPAFQEILRRVAIHSELLKKIKEGLPIALAGHCLDCVAHEDGEVVIFSDSQAFASQLRFYAPVILAKLNANHRSPFFRRVSVKNLHTTAQDSAVRLMRAPSPETIGIVKESGKAAYCDELGRALARLGTAMEHYAKEQT